MNFVDDFNLDLYYSLLDKKGLNKTWDFILNKINGKKISDLDRNNLLSFDNLGELYEIGLAHVDKFSKKELGKYYTPKDVAILMSSFLLGKRFDFKKDICDTGSGVGNLIIQVINILKKRDVKKTLKFIKDGHIWLYDIDPIAMKICISRINILMEQDVSKFINVYVGDFLDEKAALPATKPFVISNPPYGVVKKYKKNWKLTDAGDQSKELYAMFMEKILESAGKAVIVTPQSYLVANKFSKLREYMLENDSGNIYCFDNVPGMLFNGKKHGIFNSAKGNSVRAAIVVATKKKNKNFRPSYRITSLIRFNNDQRQAVINERFLNSKLGNIKQNLEKPMKVSNSLENFAYKMMSEENLKAEALLTDNPDDAQKKNALYVSTSSRYFTIASVTPLNRNGLMVIYPKSDEYKKILYLLLNSSYFYFWWRVWDGGIFFTKRILEDVPIPMRLIEKFTTKEENIYNEMIKNERNFLHYKSNAGKVQETVKFDTKYRNEINKLFFPGDYKELNKIHKNKEAI